MRLKSITKLQEPTEVLSLTVDNDHNYFIGNGYEAVNSRNSQAEVRVIAKAAEDENLLNAFFKDADIHTFVASRVYNKPESEITGAERRFSKMAVFSLLYGKTEVGMANDFMQGDVARAKKLFSDFFSAFPTIKKFIRDKHREAFKTGQIVTVFGDILNVDMPDFALELPEDVKERLLDDAFDPKVKLSSESKMKIATALRHAQNYGIQSASSTLAALGIKGLSDYFLEIGSPAKIDCFTHDSSDMDVPIRDLFDIMVALPDIAVERPKERYGIPMKIDVDWAPSGDHPLELTSREVDLEKRTFSSTFEGKKEGFEELLRRLEGCGVKVDYTIEKEFSKGVTQAELFITRRAFSLDIGKEIPYVEGHWTLDFSNVDREL